MDSNPANGPNEKGAAQWNDILKPGSVSQVPPAPEQPTNEGERSGGTTGEPSRVPCPQCAELIQAAAKVCRFCGHKIQVQGAAQVEGGGNGEHSAWPMPSMELAKVSVNEFCAMSVAMVKQRDEQQLTNHERRLIKHFAVLQEAHGEDAVKRQMAERLSVWRQRASPPNCWR
ncbi:MAG: zinc ribbon domain-containing protein [Planctomycetes bacterium]|nr:zinc ribbon domain-containing protein [Planctomycetota bacterium]